MQKILSWIALLGGEVLIYVAFRMWGGELPVEIRMLNTVVSMFILALFFVDVLFSWSDWCGERLGTLGLRWAATWLYASAAIAIMLLCNLVFEAAFAGQLVAHCILLIGLILGFVAMIGSSVQVCELHAREEEIRRGTQNMKQEIRHLQSIASGIVGLPEIWRNRIEALAEEVRFIAPCRTEEAFQLEKQFGEMLRTIGFALPEYEMNRARIESSLARAEQLCAQRKAVYTN